MKVVRSSPLRTGRLLEAHGLVGCFEKKSLVTRTGIDPGTFRLVSQRLNHYATPGPRLEEVRCLHKPRRIRHRWDENLSWRYKSVKAVKGNERPHTSAAGFNGHCDRLPYVVDGRSFFTSWETSSSSRIRRLVNKLFEAPCCPLSQSARHRVR